MADELTITYSYEVPSLDASSQSVGVAAAEDTLYAAADCERVELQNGGVLLIHRQDDRQLVVAREVSAALRACHRFRTLREHVTTLTATIAELAGQEGDVLSVLEMLRDAGFLTSAASTLARLCPQQRSPESSPASSVVAIITCDRPQALRRLLDSIRDGADLSVHQQWLLIDDSRDPANAEQNRLAVASFNAASGCSLKYCGRRAQQQMLDALQAALPQHAQGIGFLLDFKRWSSAKSYGLARSFALLFSVGSRVVVVDDDVLCMAVASPHQAPGIAFDSRPREVDFYGSSEAVREHCQPLDVDPLAGHCRYLGRSLAEVIGDVTQSAPDATLLREANGAFLDQWTADSPVLITQSGSLGDPGTQGLDWLYTVDPVSARRLLAAPGGMDAALEHRHYWMGQPRLTLTRMAVISQVTGLDNSQLLPPYFPVFRGEDYLFGAMVEYLHPEAVTLEYPWSVPHLPLMPRKGGGGPPEALAKYRLNPAKYVTDSTRYRRGVTPETRLDQLSLLARELSEMNDRSLLTLYRSEFAEAQAARLSRLQATLADGVDRPPAWRAHLEAGAAKVSASMQALARPETIFTGSEFSDQAALLAAFRDHGREFSLALAAWPAIRAAAAGIAAELFGSPGPEG